jgi:cholesterol transport system auxiliary component
MNQPAERIDFYTLEYAPPRVEDLKPIPVTILVERFTVSPLYNSTQIIYRDMSFKREAYAYHKWRANPGDLVTYFLARDMRDSGLFKAVSPEASRTEAQYMLEGSVDEFLESDTPEAWKAVLALSTTLMIASEPDISKKIIFQKTFRSTRPCRQKNPMGVAGAMSEAMAEVSGQITRTIYDALKNRE